MDNQTAIINQLKAQSIEPNQIYFQNDFSFFSKKDDSFPSEKLFTSIDNVLESKSSKHFSAKQNVSQIKLNSNYQYNDILTRRRNIIEILYPTEPFETLDDGIHFYVLDEHNQLQKKENFEEVFESPTYIRVEKQHGKVVSIQKRPLTSISHFTYNYWPNQNIKYVQLEKYNNDRQLIYIYKESFDEDGQIIESSQKNMLTQQTMHRVAINKEGIKSIEEYFDNNGILTNRVIYFDKSKPAPQIENKQFNSKGEIIKITGHALDEIFDTAKDLEESYPYNKLIMDVEKTKRVLTTKLFKHTFDKNTLQWDNEAINRAKYLEIKPNQIYYAKLPYAYFSDERYKNFPHQKPLTLIDAENQQPNANYSDLIKFEVGNNYQYKTILKEKWQQIPIDLPLEQFKPLENDIYFFVMDNRGQLTPLENIEQAIKQPSYIRVEKEMGKIISIVKKTRIYKVLNEFEYKDNNLTTSKVSVLESEILPHLIIESKYEDETNIVKYYQIKNAQGVIIRTYNYINEDPLIAVSDRFDDNGVITNHIELRVDLSNGYFYLKNQFFDEKGNVILTIDDSDKKSKDKDDSIIMNARYNHQPYDKFPIFPDHLEQIIFDAYLNQQ
ncbi:hypothetical protein A9G24_11315 [Gilliamella sp. App6-5]|uniref:hypothetical protein n=1 Tax=Gilliamella sp. App6-5 TaxID=3120232 RepID=UPI00080DDD2D|nr:hypothetical protein [Gilliamella apicola]OCG18825.1 hypothetical protein A9G24_11315 [Gilliamella apicola]